MSSKLTPFEAKADKDDIASVYIVPLPLSLEEGKI